MLFLSVLTCRLCSVILEPSERFITIFRMLVPGQILYGLLLLLSSSWSSWNENVNKIRKKWRKWERQQKTSKVTLSHVWRLLLTFSFHGESDDDRRIHFWRLLLTFSFHGESDAARRSSVWRLLLTFSIISRWIRWRQKKQVLTSFVDVLIYFTVNQMTTEETAFDVFCWRSHFTVTQMPIEDAAFDVFCWRSHSFHSEPNDNRRGSRPQYKYFCTSKRV